VVVDCDLGQGDISVPGTLAASPMDRLCLSVVDGWNHLTPLAYVSQVLVLVLVLVCGYWGVGIVPVWDYHCFYSRAVSHSFCI
jgi:hypothetical protein